MPGNRVYISRERKELMVSLADHHSIVEIANILQVSRRTVHRVLALWRNEGDVIREPLQMGRPRELNYLDLAVSWIIFLRYQSNLMCYSTLKLG